MTQALETVQETEKPLNPRQKVFAHELGIAWASGERDYTKAYAKAGFKPDRGNARRLAADPRVIKVAQDLCKQALKMNGLQIEYLQAKALQLLERSVGGVLLDIHEYMDEQVIPGEDGKEPAVVYRLRTNLTDDDRAKFEAATWCLNDLKIDDKGVITLKMPDKKGLIEMLAKQLGVGADVTNLNVGVTLEQLVGASMKDITPIAADEPKTQVVENVP